MTSTGESTRTTDSQNGGLIVYRAFRNNDTPAIVDIWRSQPPGRGLAQPMSVELFEQLVLAKPYFDREGLIIAEDDGVPVGFAHASFGPTEDEQGMSTMLGATSMVMVKMSHRGRGIGRELLARSEEYLRSRGAKVLYGGGIRPLNAFYLGLYGGSELPGVLSANREAQHLFKAAGYREIDRVIVMSRELASFRPPVDRQQLQLRRRMTVDVVEDPTPPTWWMACTVGPFDLVRYELRFRDTRELAGSATFWQMTTLSAQWGVAAAGLIDLEIVPEHRRQGMATFLLGEAFRHLQNQSIGVVEVQTMERNTAARELYAKLGFREIDSGAIYRKET